jgi:tRNA G18 (ribose-2'-O)-methylase SpoU
MSLLDPVILSGASIVEAVLRRGVARPEELLVLRGGSSRGLARLASLAESKGVGVRIVEAAELDHLLHVAQPPPAAGKEKTHPPLVPKDPRGLEGRAGEPHQHVGQSRRVETAKSSTTGEGACATPASGLRDVALALGKRESAALGIPSFVIALEGIEDPHNLGDVLRSAFAAGADVAVLDSRARAMPRDVVARSSAGASECLPLVFADQLAHALAQLRSLGVEPVAATLEEGDDAFRMKWPARLALVIGGERRGLSRATLDACPRRVTIPMSRGLQSLSAAAGAAVLLFEAARRR